MKELKFVEFSYENGVAVIPFNKGLEFSKVLVKISQSKKQGSVVVKYAQSNVLDVILFYGYKETATTILFEQVTPVCATHLFIELNDTDARLAEVIVYETEKGDNIAYPQYFDTDLGGLYSLDRLVIDAQSEGELFYTVYTSTDGQNFFELCRKKGGTAEDTVQCEGCQARYVRILVTYHSATPYVPIPKVSFTGTRLDKEEQKPVPIFVPDFEDTKYAKRIEREEKIEYLYGIVERRLGGRYRDWFSFDLLSAEKYDFFEINDQDGKIHIAGNCGVSVATGLNYYLKYYCGVHLSQVGDQIKMPNSPVLVGKKIRKETKARLRYAYNPCAHSYTMAFWSDEEWQNELDFLALSGVNLVFDFTAVEEVWRRFLGKIGYNHENIKKLLSGPAYYAWQWIGNQMGQGGPLPDAWFARRTELARKNHRMMRTLGMEVVLPGYTGMVPKDIDRYDSEVKVVPQGTWCAFDRPSMLHPNHSSFCRYANDYYEIQEKVFGKNRYFTDTLFHEGGNKEGISERVVARNVLETMIKVNADAVWVITSWQHNPSSELLAGIGELKEKHAVVLDLYGEKEPNYVKGKEGNINHGYSPEFDGTPWILCMLSNFGGRLGLHGHLDYLVKGVPKALNDTRYCAGVGMTPEASENNPVLYDFLFDCIWQENAKQPLEEICIEKWLADYAKRRYGVKNTASENVWRILSETVYKGEYNMRGQGAPESVTNARPAFHIQAASTWGNAIIGYDKNSLKQAYLQLSSFYEQAKDSDGYQYDLAALRLQVLANEAQEIHSDMTNAFKQGDKNAFDIASKRFLDIITDMDKAAAESPYFRLDRWTNTAEKLAVNTDDFTKRIFQYNARALVTTWGGYYPSEIGKLHDYSNRTWAGLLGGIYYDRWERWIEERKKELLGETPKEINWFEMEWLWIWS